MKTGLQKLRPVPDDDEPLMTPGEVAKRFKVNLKTVGRWADGGRITPVWTPGGHRRYREAEIKNFQPPLRGRRAASAKAEQPSAPDACSHGCGVHCGPAAQAA